MAMKKITGGDYSIKHAPHGSGHKIGVPTKVLDNMNKSGAGTHAKQNQGHGIGVPVRGNECKSTGATSKGSGGGIFRTRGAVLKNSGVAGAHRLGGKK